ncbi:hypothetical protein HW555_011077 [Spodoptera exigua]|uniref:Uncharacterized protein n=1 Tax=Spodoptera exigua TaxID=7107 RepID=A0A835G7N9_SPOEX|nr:hypothetical protein HW555_011077 [Spodoptera exigua]
MENKQSPSKKKLLSIQEEKLIREVDYNSLAGGSVRPPKKQLLLEILQKSPTQQGSQRVLVSIKPRAPAIKTIYIAEKSRFLAKQGEDTSGSRLGIGDHSYFTSHFAEDDPNFINSIVCGSERSYTKSKIEADKVSSVTIQVESSAFVSKCSQTNSIPKKVNVYNAKQRSAEKCYIYTQPQFNMNIPKTDVKTNKKKLNSKKVDIATLISNTSSEDSVSRSTIALNHLYERIDHLEQHNSEQYGRDFTAYDGITARGRRQCASVPCKRDDIPKMAAERVHKIRHKLNPVRDYRLMDTVHYLAQGEFAPRDDGIKLTTSREAVLSDIIWEDVCRTHWPNARLGRRAAHSERCSTRCELQRLIDSLLRERVAHVERRRRRHYRIVKLNHRHESCRPVGKTGDIIVASHKNRQGDEVAMSDHNAASAMIADRRWDEPGLRRIPRSHDRLRMETRHNRHNLERRREYEDCSPGPSYAVDRSPTGREPTCCYQASSPMKPDRRSATHKKRRTGSRELTSGSSSTSRPRNPRLVVKKVASHRKHNRDEPNLEHYILLPTLVVRTPSNMKREKKFNELYHRILNVQIKNVQNNNVPNNTQPSTSSSQSPNKKDVGLNINITLSNSKSHIKE